jgi:hypothetical protein
VASRWSWLLWEVFHSIDNSGRIFNAKGLCITNFESGHRILYQGIKSCTLVWNPVPLYEIMCQGIKTCTYVRISVPDYEIMYLRMKLCTWEWNYVLRRKFHLCTWGWNYLPRYGTALFAFYELCSKLDIRVKTFLEALASSSGGIVSYCSREIGVHGSWDRIPPG